MGQRYRHGVQSGLGPRIGHNARHGLDGGHGRNIDNHASLRIGHAAADICGQTERAFEIQVDHAVKLALGHFMAGNGGRFSSIIDQNIDLAEMLVSRMGQLIHRIPLCRVNGQRQALAPHRFYFSNNALAVFQLAAGDNQIRTPRSIGQRHLTPKTARAARDDGHLAGKIKQIFHAPPRPIFSSLPAILLAAPAPDSYLAHQSIGEPHV